MKERDQGTMAGAPKGAGWPTAIPGLGVVLALDLPPHTVPFERFRQAIWAWHRKFLLQMVLVVASCALVFGFFLRPNYELLMDCVRMYSFVLAYFVFEAAVELLWAVHWVRRRGDLEVQSGTISSLEAEWVNGKGDFRRYGLRSRGWPFESNGIVIIRFRTWVPLRYEMLVVDLNALPSDESREVFRKIVRLKPPKGRKRHRAIEPADR